MTSSSTATPKNQRVLVVGGGVTGFTTAWALLYDGYDVTIISDRWADPKNRIAFQIAGALWEWPPAVCGKHTDVFSLKKSKNWCMPSYNIFDKLQETIPPIKNLKAFDHGVRLGMANFFFVEELKTMADSGQLDKWNEIQAMSPQASLPLIKGVKRDPTLIDCHQVNKKAEAVSVSVVVRGRLRVRGRVRVDVVEVVVVIAPVRLADEHELDRSAPDDKSFDNVESDGDANTSSQASDSTSELSKPAVVRSIWLVSDQELGAATEFRKHVFKGKGRCRMLPPAPRYRLVLSPDSSLAT